MIKQKQHSIQVALGLIIRKTQVLLSVRSPHVTMPGLWEFPGGKVELNETIEQALIRELQEEVAIQVEEATPLLVVPYLNEGVLIELNAWTILSFSGEPSGNEGQPIAWVSFNELTRLNFPKVNRPDY